MGKACLQNGGEHRLLKIAMYGELFTGYHDRGASKKSFKDSPKKTLSTCHIDHHQWSALVADRQAWRYTVNRLLGLFHLWGLPQSQPLGETPQEEDPGSLSSNPR